MDDGLFKCGLKLYDGKFDMGVCEEEEIFKEWLRKEGTKDD
ncbi:hypothetical protein [Staphylococcus saprophyticus]|nr:hypothetical protein [Staphylococcus saprophyticus]